MQIKPRKQDELIGRLILDMAEMRPGAPLLCKMGTISAWVSWQPKPMAGLEPIQDRLVKWCVPTITQHGTLLSQAS